MSCVSDYLLKQCYVVVIVRSGNAELVQLPEPYQCARAFAKSYNEAGRPSGDSSRAKVFKLNAHKLVAHICDDLVSQQQLKYLAKICRKPTRKAK